MQRKFLSREKKIKFLSDFSKGLTTIKDITPPVYDVWFELPDGTLQNEKRGEKSTRDEFNERTKGKQVITFR